MTSGRVGIDADAVRVDISGSGDATVSGAADDGEFTVVGSGDLDASELRVGDGAADVSGSGDLSVHAVDSLDASISGSGEISYEGSPRLSSDISGSGSISGD